MNRVATTDRTPQELEADYGVDFAAWAQRQAALLRAGRLNEADIGHIAEELEGLANSDRRALASQVRRILVHLIKLKTSLASEPRAGWRSTVQNARDEIAVILENSPSLKREVSGIMAREVGRATRTAKLELSDHGEDTSAVDDLQFTEDEVVGPSMPD